MQEETAVVQVPCRTKELITDVPRVHLAEGTQVGKNCPVVILAERYTQPGLNRRVDNDMTDIHPTLYKSAEDQATEIIVPNSP